MAEHTADVKLPKGGKLKKVRISEPPFSGGIGDSIPDSQAGYVNASIRDVRILGTIKAIRALARVNGMVSTAVQSYVSLAMSGYSVAGYESGTHLFSRDGTIVAETIIANMDTLNDYSAGYSDKRTVNQLLETLIKEVILTGECAGELVLNDQRLPDRIVPFATDEVEWTVKKDKRKFPTQRSQGGDDIPLDLPTVWIESLNKEATSVYARSMLESCLNTVYMFVEFLEDMSRVVRKSGHSRVVAKVIVEQAVTSAPASVRQDPAKLTSYLAAVRDSAEDALKNMEPNDAIVSFDNIEFAILSDSSAKSEYTDLLESLNGLVATSLKSMPSVLGLRIGKGSQSLSNTETLLYLKQVEAARAPVEAIMSRALTLASRLIGSDIYVKFRFDPIDLRPSNEIEAHKAIKQSRILEQLSLGFLSDDEAAYQLGSGFRDTSMPELSGTMFREGNGIAVDETAITPNNGPQEKALAPKDTSAGRGKNTEGRK